MHLRHLIDMKKREIEDWDHQFNNAIDPEIMRLKLKKDIEAPFRIELEAKDKEIQRLKAKSEHWKHQYEL